MYANMKGYIKPVAMTLCSPLLKLPPNAMPYSLAKMISFSLKNTPASVLPTGAGKNKNKVFTKNTATQSYEGYMRYRNSPFPHLSPTFGWVAATIAACEEVISPKNLELITCPIQILFGSEERIVDPSVYSSWCSSATKVTHSKIELIKIAGARHELLNEIPRIELLVLSYIQNWIDKYPISEQQP